MPEDSLAPGSLSQEDVLTPDSGVDVRHEVGDGWEMVSAPG